MSENWYYADENGPIGPLTIQKLKAVIVSIPNWRDVLVWRYGYDNWVRAGQIPELAMAPPPLPNRKVHRNEITAGQEASEKTINVLTLLFSFRGRHNRAKFWLISLLGGLVWLGFAGIAGYFAVLQENGAALAMIAICWLVFGIWFQTANFVKRLHDMNASGWWVLLVYAIDIALNATYKMVDPQAHAVIAGIGILISFATAAIVGGPEGTEGPNKYGPDPLRR